MKKALFLFAWLLVSIVSATTSNVLPPATDEGMPTASEVPAVEAPAQPIAVLEAPAAPAEQCQAAPAAKATKQPSADTATKAAAQTPAKGSFELTLSLTWGNFIQLFFLFCPFFVLNMFLSLTEGVSAARKRWLATHVFIVILVVGTISYFAGNAFLSLFGLNIEGFRIGAGILLMSMALGLAMGSETPTANRHSKQVKNLVVVPLGIPIIMGPACVSPIIIMGAERMQDASIGFLPFVVSFLGFVGAMLGLCTILYFAETIERLCGKTVIRIFSKLSGIILMAIAAQMICKGIMSFLDQSLVGQKILEALA